MSRKTSLGGRLHTAQKQGEIGRPIVTPSLPERFTAPEPPLVRAPQATAIAPPPPFQLPPRQPMPVIPTDVTANRRPYFPAATQTVSDVPYVEEVVEEVRGPPQASWLYRLTPAEQEEFRKSMAHLDPNPPAVGKAAVGPARMPPFSAPPQWQPRAGYTEDGMLDFNNPPKRGVPDAAGMDEVQQEVDDDGSVTKDDSTAYVLAAVAIGALLMLMRR